MKKLTLIALLVAGVCAVQAEDNKPEPKKDGPKGAPKPGGVFRGGEGFTKELNLTADQQAKLEAFSKEQREKMAGLKDLTAEQRRDKFQEFGKTRQEFMAKLLTAEQAAKMKELQPKRGPGRPGGKPPEKK